MQENQRRQSCGKGTTNITNSGWQWRYPLSQYRELLRMQIIKNLKYFFSWEQQHGWKCLNWAGTFYFYQIYHGQMATGPSLQNAWLQQYLKATIRSSVSIKYVYYVNMPRPIPTFYRHSCSGVNSHSPDSWGKIVQIPGWWSILTWP